MTNEFSVIMVGQREKINQKIFCVDWRQKKICSELINSTGATSLKDMGKVMGELKKKYSDNLDFAKAGSLLKELLKN